VSKSKHDMISGATVGAGGHTPELLLFKPVSKAVHPGNLFGVKARSFLFLCLLLNSIFSPPDIVYQLIFAFVFYFIVASFILFSLYELEKNIIVSKIIKKNGFYGSFKN
jgi:hypothetical protein